MLAVKGYLIRQPQRPALYRKCGAALPPRGRNAAHVSSMPVLTVAFRVDAKMHTRFRSAPSSAAWDAPTVAYGIRLPWLHRSVSESTSADNRICTPWTQEPFGDCTCSVHASRIDAL